MRLLGKRRAAAFAELVDDAEIAGFLAGPLGDAYLPEDAERYDGMKSLLIGLKDCRKQAKHRGSDGARSWLDIHFWAMGMALARVAWRSEKAASC